MNNFVTSIHEVPQKDVVDPTKPGLEGVKIQVLTAGTDDSATMVMRRFELAPGNGIVPLHTHPYEHQVYVISGEGIALNEELGDSPVTAGSVIYTDGTTPHGFKNISETEPFVFLCMIPKQ
ncbi:hypothetical protein PCE1_003522 [Barthelona sp. PCE]